MSTHYTAGGMPLAFTQEDFLVENKYTQVFALSQLPSGQGSKIFDDMKSLLIRVVIHGNYLGKNMRKEVIKIIYFELIKFLTRTSNLDFKPEFTPRGFKKFKQNCSQVGN